MNELVRFENGEIIVAEQLCREIAEFEIKKAEMDIKQKELKQELKEAMENHNIVAFDNDWFKITYRKPSERTTVNSAKLKEELPDVYEEYSKTSKVASSVSIAVKWLNSYLNYTYI